MESTLEKLWNGLIAPCENCGEDEPEIQATLQLIKRNREDLTRELSERQKPSLKITTAAQTNIFT